MSGSWCVLLVACLVAQALCLPAGARPWLNRHIRSPQDNIEDNAIDTGDKLDKTSLTTTTSTTLSPFAEEEEEDDFFKDDMDTAPTTGGGSNIFSLLNLAGALFPSSSGASNIFLNLLTQYLLGNRPQTFGNFGLQQFQHRPLLLRRKDVNDNIIPVEYVKELTPPFQRQEDESHDDESHEDDDDSSESQSDENDAAEESVEQPENNNKSSRQESLSEDDNDSDYSDEPPGGGDGQGGGILGLIAGLSGGDEGSDLGSLLAAVSGIVVNLSGDGFDLNSVIASGLGLFAGLLSEGEENPGAIIASYLLTSLDTITGGGANNNGAFFGNLVSKLVKGTSAAGNESGSSEENAKPMSDSTAFFLSLIMSLLGDMSKGSSGGSSHPW